MTITIHHTSGSDGDYDPRSGDGWRV